MLLGSRKVQPPLDPFSAQVRPRHGHSALGLSSRRGEVVGGGTWSFFCGTISCWYVYFEGEPTCVSEQ